MFYSHSKHLTTWGPSVQISVPLGSISYLNHGSNHSFSIIHAVFCGQFPTSSPHFPVLKICLSTVVSCTSFLHTSVSRGDQKAKDAAAPLLYLSLPSISHEPGSNTACYNQMLAYLPSHVPILPK